MACNLLPTSLSHRFCHKDETKGWILIKTSVHGNSKCVGCAFDKASFAARSACSFPVISRWLGIQQNVMNLPLDNTFKWDRHRQTMKNTKDTDDSDQHWIGLDLFNDDTCPSGHISRPTPVNVSQSCFNCLNKLLKLNYIVQVWRLLDWIGFV